MNKRVRTFLCFFRYILSKCSPERVQQFMLPAVDYMCAHLSNIEISIIISSKLFIFIHILNYTYSSLNFFSCRLAICFLPQILYSPHSSVKGIFVLFLITSGSYFMNLKFQIFIWLIHCAQSLSHVWLCNPIDCSPPGSSVNAVFQASDLYKCFFPAYLCFNFVSTFDEKKTWATENGRSNRENGQWHCTSQPRLQQCMYFRRQGWELCHQLPSAARASFKLSSAQVSLHWWSAYCLGHFSP